ncbi:hypothetical protein [Mycolicibacterium mengxianglii]|uniref:hypothetical protein n=1 Tax=Mycolicibacterium mengxianglii TaxID=2736649 RepID=UPI0018D1A426|nr:hypothetical protein [Mycolicibacterium mengxianglii]
MTGTTGSTVVIPKSTAHQTITCMGALVQAYRQDPPAGAAQAVGELTEDSRTLVARMQASGDATVRVPVATLSRIADQLTRGAQAETGSEALQSALWRTAGRLQRWIAHASAEAAPARAAGASHR